MEDALLQQVNRDTPRFRHQMFEFEHQPILDSRRAITTALEETGTTNLAQLNQAAADYPYHSIGRLYRSASHLLANAMPALVATP